MRQFWFDFKEPVSPYGSVYGVTAADRDDAFCILLAELDRDELPEPVTIVEDIPFAQLDEKRVVPNMGMFILRGIWYPHGFRQPFLP